MSRSVEVKGVNELRKILAQAPERIRNGFHTDIGVIAGKILETAKGLIKSRSGWLRDSGYVIPMGLGPTVSYTVGFGASYAAAVHEGSRPRMIYPRREGGVLRFEAGGQVVFSRYVNHPRTRPQNFLTAAVTHHTDELVKTIRDNVDKWLEWSKS